MFLSFQITFKNNQFKTNLKSSAPSVDRLIVYREVTPGRAMKSALLRGKIERELSGANVMGNAKDIGCYGDTRAKTIWLPFEEQLQGCSSLTCHSLLTASQRDWEDWPPQFH